VTACSVSGSKSADGQLIAQGEAAFIRRGETHSKGSETGLTALIVEVRDLIPSAQ
jgi:hypothetical protein